MKEKYIAKFEFDGDQAIGVDPVDWLINVLLTVGCSGVSVKRDEKPEREYKPWDDYKLPEDTRFHGA